jgi:hypothetical protein
MWVVEGLLFEVSAMPIGTSNQVFREKLAQGDFANELCTKVDDVLIRRPVEFV